MRVTILGCGGSGGVPLLGGRDGGGEWGDCDPAEPRNRRTRTSALIEGPGGGRLLIDAGPDLRQQMLACRVSHFDSVVFTHAHADHILGIDDIRQVNRSLKRSVDAFGTRLTLQKLDERFDYAFIGPTEFFFRPALEPRPIAYGEHFETAGMTVHALRQDHGVMETLGLRVGDFAYSTDVVQLPEESLAALEGLDTWVVGCFQYRAHHVHANLERVLDWVARLRPRRTVLTHMSTAMDYGRLLRELPAGVEPAYDGLVLEVG
ncbi:MBL fold metallo-hydrolase [Roseicella aquatilis]|uniref:MBL fold metallo-hydrolase n=1 Tax=Roseicella aquatilis TaxID=2527868 RepID=A0A4R4DWZ1_9PROT|nr:MBL fold metallo-hydrolase [Roseicella aquatilis]TCZ66918.1 MBL fold metallo-hydrolase [Roseicella aquatilis]